MTFDCSAGATYISSILDRLTTLSQVITCFAIAIGLVSFVVWRVMVDAKEDEAAIGAARRIFLVSGALLLVFGFMALFLPDGNVVRLAACVKGV